MQVLAGLFDLGSQLRGSAFRDLEFLACKQDFTPWCLGCAFLFGVGVLGLFAFVFFGYLALFLIVFGRVALVFRVSDQCGGLFKRIDCQFGFVPPERMDSNKTSQNGEVEMTRAAIPEGICFSASATSPLPPRRSKVPTTAVAFQLLVVGLGSPAARRQRYRMAPEIRKRIDA